MADKTNPEALKDLNAIIVSDEIKEFIKDIAYSIEEEKSNRSWWETQIDTYRNLRYGVRNEKTFPWPKAANYVLPLIDSEINRVKPSYLNLISVYPMVSFEPYGAEDIEAARKREALRDWQLRTKMSFFEKYALGVDFALEQGSVIWKITWKFSTRVYTKFIDLNELDERVLQAIYDPIVTDEILYQILVEEFKVDESFEENVKAIEGVVKKFREGDSKFEFELVEAKDDQPELTPCSIRDDIVFPYGTTDLSNARFIDYIFPISKNDLKIDMADDKYEQYDDRQIDAWINNTSLSQQRKPKTKPTAQSKSDDTLWLHETCCWHDINGDGIKEKCIATWPDSEPNAVLRFIELPYEHGEWPYVLTKRELNDTGVFSSRGYCALLEDFQNGISTSFNQSVDNGTITNTPQVVTKRNTLVNIRNLRYVPGNHVETNGPTTDYEIRMLGNASQPYLFQQAQYLKSWADQRTGSFTSGLSQINNQAGQGQGGNKTKREIDVISTLETQVQSMDLQIWQNQMAKVYYQIDALYDQYEDKEDYELITNEKLVRMSRKEIQGKFNIVPTGRLDNSNPELRLKRTFSLYQMFINDPDIRQRELKKMILQDFDVKLIQSLFKTEEEVAQEQRQAMAMQEGMKKKTMEEQIGLKSIADLMDVQKQKALVPIQGKKYAPE